MLLFLISIFLVFATSFFFSSILEEKSFVKFLIYFLLISFANIVLMFEILSLFSAISIIGVLCFNFLFATVALILWRKFGKPLPKFDFCGFFKRLYVALKSDKYLAVLGLGTMFMAVVSLWLISFMPVVNPDAESYHVLRSLLWIFDGKISHMQIADARNLVMPINSEILYAWVLLFVKKPLLFGIFSFCGYVLSITSLWKILSFIGVGFRRRLWTIFLVSSFASVIMQISSTETDIIVAGLVLSSIYLFWDSLKNEKIRTIVMSSLAYALAVGVKTPSIMLIPSVGLWMLGMSIFYKKKNFYKPVAIFCVAFTVLFLIFSSYNYILNYIDFGDIAGSRSFLSIHKNFGGITAACANFIKYIFMFFDFTGFALQSTLGTLVTHLRDSILILFGLEQVSEGFFSTSTAQINSGLLEPLMGLGVLGFLVYLPCLFVAFIRPIFTKRKRDILIMSFALIFVGGIAVMSYSIAFMTFNVRFFTSFCVVASPVLVYSYCRKGNFVKFIITFFAMFYLLFLSTHLWSRPALLISRYFRHGATISEVREIATCSRFNNKISKQPNALQNSPVVNEMCKIRNEIRKYPTGTKVLYFSNMSDALLVLKLMNYQGYTVDFGTMEASDDVDFSKYDVILTANDGEISTTVNYFDNLKSGQKEYIHDGIVCSYLDTKNNILTTSSPIYPYLVSCNVTSYFFRNHGFESDKSLTLHKLVEGEDFTMVYKFYRK